MGSLAKAVTIVGAGTQGRRLAFMWSRKGRPVHLIDQNEAQLQEAAASVTGFQSQHPSLAEDKTWGAVDFHHPDDLAKAAQESWLAIDCVYENLPAKKKLVASLDEVCRPDTIIASNSSSYTISDIIKDLGILHPQRAVSLHSYWPPETCAIEIMGSKQTDPSIIPTLIRECKAHGFSPYHVKGDSIGYLYNRIWAAIKRETLLALSEGIATPQEIDAIFKDVLKTPKGPCEQMDVVGLDVVLNIEEHYAETRKGIPEGPRELLKQMLAENKLGIKSKKGFYDYGK